MEEDQNQADDRPNSPPSLTASAAGRSSEQAAIDLRANRAHSDTLSTKDGGQASYTPVFAANGEFTGYNTQQQISGSGVIGLSSNTGTTYTSHSWNPKSASVVQGGLNHRNIKLESRGMEDRRKGGREEGEMAVEGEGEMGTPAGRGQALLLQSHTSMRSVHPSCTHCGATKTSVWRKGADPESLYCNACGLYVG